MRIEPIARIRTPFESKFGVPRQSGLAKTQGRIVLEPAYRSPEAVRGIEGFSHLWLIWGFFEAEYKPGTLTVRPPRLGGNERVGVFASRSPFRPNSLGLSCVRLLGVEYDAADGPALLVEGADLLSGSPIYDIKPYLPFADSVPDALSGYVDTVAYRRLTVEFACDTSCIENGLLQTLREVLAEDPRPHYQNDPAREYAFEFAGYRVRFVCADGTARVTGLDALQGEGEGAK